MYLVCGATGRTGAVVAATLLSHGKKVRVLVRDAAKGESWRKRGADVAVGSLDDERQITEAMAGVESSFVLVPPRLTSQAVRAENVRVSDNLRRAVEVSRVKHVVLLSSLGAAHDAGTGPIASLHGAESKLGGSTALTSIRAGYFMENWGGSLAGVAGGKLPTFLKLDRALPMVATADIGTIAAQALLEGPPGRRIIDLAAPRDYSPNDVAAALSALVGKPVRAEQGPESAVVATFTSYGMSADMAELYREMIHALNEGTVTWSGGDAVVVRGTTPIETVLKGLLAGAP